MTGSALLGHPPNTQEDLDIIKGFFFLSAGMPLTQAMEKSAIIPVVTPPNAPHDSKSGELIAVMAVVMALAVTITGTRLSLRLFRKDLKWGMDDWAIIVGLIGVLASFSIVIQAATVGKGGKHLYDLTYLDFANFVSINGYGEPVFYVTLGVIKISITLFNRRLTGLTSRKWMISHNTFLILLVGYIIAAPIAISFTCNPPVLLFRLQTLGRTTDQRHCFNQNKVIIPLSVLHTAFDFALLTVPLVVLFKMQMDLSRKIRLCILFSVGSLSCIGAVMRNIIQSSKQQDITYQYPDFQKWVIIDMFFAITAASLPVLNSLLPKHWHTRSDSDATAVNSSEWDRSKGENMKLGSISTLKSPPSFNITITAGRF